MFRGERRAAALIEFVTSPASYLLEADVAARGEGNCLAALQARGVVAPLEEGAGLSQHAHVVVEAAHRCVAIASAAC